MIIVTRGIKGRSISAEYKRYNIQGEQGELLKRKAFDSAVSKRAVWEEELNKGMHSLYGAEECSYIFLASERE